MATETYMIYQPNTYYDRSEFAGGPSGSWMDASSETFDTYEAAEAALLEWQREQPEIGTLGIGTSERGPREWSAIYTIDEQN